jgi:flagellar biosynthetic protein FliR
MITIAGAQLESLVAAYFCPFVRILAFVLSAPIFGNPSVPLRLRIGLAAVLSFIIAPVVAVPEIDALSLPGVAILAQQVLIGVTLGLTLRMIFVAAEAAGEFVGLQMGLGYATFFDPERADQVPVLGQFIGLLAMLVFLALDGHLQVVQVLARSFATIPVGGALHAGGLLTLAYWGSEIFTAGVMIAMPLLAALLIANLALGVLTRAAPQLNLFAVGFPVTLALGLVTLALSLPFVTPVLQQLFDAGYATMTKATQEFALR